MTPEFLNKAVRHCRLIIGEEASTTDAKIDQAIEMVKNLLGAENIDTIRLKQELQTIYSTQVDTFRILVGRDRRQPWLNDFKANGQSEWKFWKRYKEYLENKGFAPRIIENLDILTDKILDNMFNPKVSNIQLSKKGLVVGQVQSGKTANYTGLICKAADAGFNFIIVLAGIHNNLRSQTQARLDEGFLGFDTQFERVYANNAQNKIGVGRSTLYPNLVAHSITTSAENGDFTKRAAGIVNFNTSDPILLVIKKNVAVLKRLYTWLKTQSNDNKINSKSVLVIDDEADNASVNTNKQELDPTKINGLIRDIINIFNRNVYVGYTATPFANIFIAQDDTDLFPRDFIINLPAPSNYIGPEKVFGTSINIGNNTISQLPHFSTTNAGSSFAFIDNTSRGVRKEILSTLKQFDGRPYPLPDSHFTCLGDLHKTLTVEIVDKIPLEKKRIQVTLRGLLQIKEIIEKKNKEIENLRKNMIEQMTKSKDWSKEGSLPRFYTIREIDDLIEKNKSTEQDTPFFIEYTMKINGFYNRKSGQGHIVLENNNTILYTYVHEMMHAYFDSFNLTIPMKDVEFVEEPLAEYGMLLFLWNDKYIDLFYEAQDAVNDKKYHLGCSHYGFANDIFEQYRHIDWLKLMYNAHAYIDVTATYMELQKKLLEMPHYSSDIKCAAQLLHNVLTETSGTSILISPSDQNNDDLLPIVIPINDYNNFVPQKHRKEDEKPKYDDIPESLKVAIKCFIITCAIRIARGQGNKHNSMLIHLSRFQVWQNAIKELVDQLFNYYKQEIDANDPTILEEFRKIFEEDAGNYTSYTSTTNKILNSSLATIDNNMQIHEWEEIKPLLNRAAQKIIVKSINGSSGDVIDYQQHENTGISVIAIGGDKLSRGLTLEGLSVSYFLRASKMYDTLMQMGRWFGYRPGYVDLCRLFTSPELNEWFRHITLASEELRDEFNYLAESGQTPEQYALKVRQHDGVLQITAINKMRNTREIEVSWAGKLRETYQLPMDKGLKQRNLIATQELIDTLGTPEPKENNKGNYLWRNVSPGDICTYFTAFNVAKSLKKVNLELICDYIKKLVQKGELTSWRVVLMNKENANKKFSFGPSIDVGCFDRTRADEIGDDTYFIKKNHIVGNQTDEFIDIDEDILNEALNTTMREQGKEWNKPYPSPKIVREEFRSPTNPLLIIYPLNPVCANIKNTDGSIKAGTIQYTEEDTPFIGFAIAFPHSNIPNNAVAYVVNRIAEFAETEDNFDKEDDNNYDGK